MKVITIGLTYGNRPLDIIRDNLSRAGFYTTHTFVNKEGIANALNDGLDLMLKTGSDAVAFLSNDIEEPNNWLHKKVQALLEYPDAGAVASSIHEVETEIRSQLIISNWLVSREAVNRVGYFQESMFPYGPIDLDYCQRLWAAGLKTYYVKDCLALHNGSHATGDEYGWNKDELVAAGWGKMYKQGEPFKIERSCQVKKEENQGEKNTTQ